MTKRFKDVVIESVEPEVREWPTLGYTVFYSMCKSNRKQGNEEFWISSRWRNSNCNSGPTDAEAFKAGAKWGYGVEIGMDGYRFYEVEAAAPEGTLNG